ncbi:MAG: hypothetical protein AAF355_05515 [Myxococcota bacterium]
MDDKAEARWELYLVQARRFAEKETYLDAVERIRLVRDEVRHALDRESDNQIRDRLGRRLRRVESELTQLEGLLEQWRAQLSELKAQRRAGADEEMKRPLPKPAPQAQKSDRSSA